MNVERGRFLLLFYVLFFVHIDDILSFFTFLSFIVNRKTIPICRYTYMDDVHFFHILLALFFILKFFFFFFFLLKRLQIGQILLVSKERFESVTSGRTKGRKREKHRRSPPSLIGSSPPERKTVRINTHNAYIHA
jgi:hypothetical protein